MEKLWTKENFKCDRYCGECCKKMLVNVDSKDIKRIERLGYKKNDFVMEDVFDPKRKFLKKQKNGWCGFLEKDKNGKYSCKIHKNRPKICRDYPFFPGTPKKIKSCLPEDLYPNVFFKLPSSNNQ